MNQTNTGFFARQKHATVEAKIITQFQAYLHADGTELVRCCTWFTLATLRGDCMRPSSSWLCCRQPAWVDSS